MTILENIISQHAEESAFLWLLRDSAVNEPHYKLSDLAHLDNRVEANIDGLRIAGDDGWETCKGALFWEEPGEVFTAAILAFESGIDKRIDTVLEVCNDDYELTRGLISALGWIPFEQVKEHVLNLIKNESSSFRRIALAAHITHRQDPDQFLIKSLTDSESLMRTNALYAAGALGKINLLPDIKAHLNEEDENCRFFAAWSGGILGDSASMSVLRNIAEKHNEYSKEACCMVLRHMEIQNAHEWLQRLSQQPYHERLSVTGYGILGDPAHIPLLIEKMATPDFARVAGESFSMITGVDIAYEDLEGDWPEGFEAGPTENPEDEKVEMDLDEDLFWPDPEKISVWWSENNQHFQNGTRYLCGKPITVEQCQHILKYGYQRQRTAAAIELAVMNPGQPLFEVRAPGFRQQKLVEIN